MVELTRAFLAHLPDGVRSREWIAAGEALVELYRAGGRAWPGVLVDPAWFGRHLATVVESPEGVRELHADGLYLAAACLAGDPEAAAIFERHHRGDIEAVVARLGLGPQGDEIRQRLMRALFLGDERRPPFLASYAGRGALKSWLKVVALREAYNVARERQQQGRREVNDDDLILERAVHEHDPELEHLRAAYGGHLKRAFEQAFAALEVRDRQLLRFQYLDGLNIEQVGAFFNVSRATAARWRSRLLVQLLRDTRQRLGDVLELSDHDVESVMKLVRSQLDLSIARLLGTRSPQS